jgi:peptidoglycan/xylan/chitin deacetylase (PgdA/CDA1 family)
MKPKAHVVRLVHHLGGLRLYHRIQNATSLTVVMFHRVLATGDSRWRSASPDWTVSADLFEQCLDFFAENYSVVSHHQMLEAARQGSDMPKNPLLITFDDGWTDVLDTAGPLLKKRGMPSIIFVIAGALDGQEPWQEPVLEAWFQHRIPDDRLRQLWHATAGSSEPWPPSVGRLPHPVLDRLTKLPSAERERHLLSLVPDLRARLTPGIVTPEQARHFPDFGIEVGSHGFTHQPLTSVRDYHAELSESYKVLDRLFGPRPGEWSLSFPHGGYDASIAKAAFAAGFRFLFTSDPHLTDWRSPALPHILGRINISTSQITDARGRFRPESLATHLFRRPRRVGAVAV